MLVTAWLADRLGHCPLRPPCSKSLRLDLLAHTHLHAVVAGRPKSIGTSWLSQNSMGSANTCWQTEERLPVEQTEGVQLRVCNMPQQQLRFSRVCFRGPLAGHSCLWCTVSFHTAMFVVLFWPQRLAFVCVLISQRAGRAMMDSVHWDPCVPT